VDGDPRGPRIRDLEDGCSWGHRRAGLELAADHVAVERARHDGVGEALSGQDKGRPGLLHPGPGFGYLLRARPRQQEFEPALGGIDLLPSRFDLVFAGALDGQLQRLLRRPLS
jgi:hypothetical protein